MGFKKHIVGIAIALGASLLLAAWSRGDVLYQSGTASSSLIDTGVGIGGTSQQYVGVRFDVQGPVTVDAVGGSFSMDAGQLMPVDLFGELVYLGSSDVPSDPQAALSLGHRIASTTFTVSNTWSTDITLPVAPVTLTTGSYALFFGPQSTTSDLQATASTSGSDVGSPSFIVRQGNNAWYSNTTLHERFYVIAVPLPGVAGSAGVLLVLLGLSRLSRRSTRAVSSN